VYLKELCDYKKQMDQIKFKNKVKIEKMTKEYNEERK
jgi:hypothetical protein